ncbi:reverse transcriptase [Caerostris extrusa]|uniref:Reverse transcriptase n=1 Tax=Caerostris extrusa TaxID=172846 RepID=A0AAV4R080_CAEEX|nr:reverse transcriptase [Caerostris extrusa]
MKESCVAVGSPTINFDAQIESIDQAPQKLSTITTHNKAVFIDSCAAIQTLMSSKNDTTRVTVTRILLHKLLINGWTITVQWVPSHSGIPNNECADRLARTGCSLHQPSCSYPYSIVCNEIKWKFNNTIKNYYVTETTGKSQSVLLTNPLPDNLPRHVATANFRLFTSYDYLYRIGISPSPDCLLCSEETL